jgi:plastocyanin
MSRPFPHVLIVCSALFAAACGGSGYSSPSNPSTSGVSAATITIAGGAVSPAAVTIAASYRVTFVNNDTVAHTMASDPHPAHTDCPALNVGTISPGQSRDSGVLNVVRTCGFHDHDNPDNAALKGAITVQ